MPTADKNKNKVKLNQCRYAMLLTAPSKEKVVVVNPLVPLLLGMYKISKGELHAVHRYRSAQSDIL